MDLIIWFFGILAALSAIGLALSFVVYIVVALIGAVESGLWWVGELWERHERNAELRAEKRASRRSRA